MPEPTAWVPLVRVLLVRLVDVLPKFLLKRLYPRESLTAHIDLDLSIPAGMEFALYGVPRVYLWVRVTNRSPYLDVEVDRLHVDIWDSQPLATAATDDVIAVPRSSRNEDFRCENELNEFQVKKIREVAKTLEPRFKAYLKASLNTSLGRIEIKKTIENVPTRVTG
jgi:hypothetical protein